MKHVADGLLRCLVRVSASQRRACRSLSLRLCSSTESVSILYRCWRTSLHDGSQAKVALSAKARQRQFFFFCRREKKTLFPAFRPPFALTLALNLSLPRILSLSLPLPKTVRTSQSDDDASQEGDQLQLRRRHPAVQAQARPLLGQRLRRFPAAAPVAGQLARRLPRCAVCARLQGQKTRVFHQETFGAPRPWNFNE